MVRRRVHDGREFAAVISRCMPSALHAFNDIHILGEHGLPHRCVGCPHLGIFVTANSFIRIIDLDLLDCTAIAVRQQQDGEGVIIVNAKQHIREKGDVFGASVPFRRQAFEMRETASVSADLRLVDKRSLSGKAAGVEDVVMVLQPRIAVQVGMDEGKVIGFAVILDCELPVAVKREADRAVLAGMDQRLLEFLPAFDQLARRCLECRCRRYSRR